MRTVETVRLENDIFRKTMLPSRNHRIIFSEIVADMADEKREQLITLVRNFTEFNEENDPNGEHDFGRVKLDSKDYFFKIDYLDSDWHYGVDPLEQKPNRVMTLMSSKEW
jgi:hypothetical protein